MNNLSGIVVLVTSGFSLIVLIVRTYLMNDIGINNIEIIIIATMINIVLGVLDIKKNKLITTVLIILISIYIFSFGTSCVQAFMIIAILGSLFGIYEKIKRTKFK